jgi:hypothetical protein
LVGANCPAGSSLSFDRAPLNPFTAHEFICSIYPKLSNLALQLAAPTESRRSQQSQIVLCLLQQAYCSAVAHFSWVQTRPAEYN